MGWDIHFFRCNGGSYGALLGSFLGVVSKLPKAHCVQISFFLLCFIDFLKLFHLTVEPLGEAHSLWSTFKGRGMTKRRELEGFRPQKPDFHLQ